MYITYETAQYSSSDEHEISRRVKPATIVPNDLPEPGISRRVKPLVTIPNDLPEPDFMPTKLVRISDMKVVDGSQVNEGYCALSYSWNQSGDILIDETTGKYKRIDEGKHKIISYDNIFPDMIIPRYKISDDNNNRNKKLDKIYQVFNIMDDHNHYFSKTIQYVKFEGIIQRICQQFNIKYIWYDQLCINQDNKEEKQREIRNMHQIYENAYCTVALVPDYNNDDDFLRADEQQYFKRLWTLEEAIKSERLLFVGRDKHLYGDDTFWEIKNLAKSSSELNVSQILYHAHQRTSTNEHDRVFALIQLFPELIDKIRIDYDQPFEDLMIQFYGLLAKTDLSIMIFGYSRSYNSTIKKYKFLPSWTGVNGRHFIFDITTSFQNYDIIGETMHVTTTYVPSIDNGKLTIREEDIPPINGNINDGDNKDDYRLCILVQLSKAKEMRRIDLDYYGDYWRFDRKSFFDEISKKLQQLSRFMEIKKENLCWCHRKSDDYQIAALFNFDPLTESLNDPSAQHVILSEISFKWEGYDHWLYPVIKKKKGEEYYRTIGYCGINKVEDFFSNCNLNKETFFIQ